MSTMFGKRVRPDENLPATTHGEFRPDDIADIAYAGGVPIITICLVLLLSLIYAVEFHFSGGAGQDGFSPRELVKFGGNNDELVLVYHEYWRVFTAPLLHSSAIHLVGNCIALLMAGWYLEKILGPWWFAAAFVLGGIGGCVGSFNLNGPGIVSVGASGAIMGLLAMTLMLAYREDDDTRAFRMMIWSARIMMPSLLPLASHGHINYAAHFGGAVAGLLLYLTLSTWWEDSEMRPPFANVAAGIVAAAFLFATYGFAFGSA